jgi:hypothetical protein
VVVIPEAPFTMEIDIPEPAGVGPAGVGPVGVGPVGGVVEDDDEQATENNSPENNTTTAMRRMATPFAAMTEQTDCRLSSPEFSLKYRDGCTDARRACYVIHAGLSSVVKCPRLDSERAFDATIEIVCRQIVSSSPTIGPDHEYRRAYFMGERKTFFRSAL